MYLYIQKIFSSILIKFKKNSSLKLVEVNYLSLTIAMNTMSKSN